ncbi:MAG: class I SAM-dependent methyltransferase [Campylobacterales bacterium]|nr:class I SAM-dependent methyltransferase [Campylobacterales bacterium]MBN2833115.1 class I SAM-dependent methyltransferase [Campylobacterales bacterium]
MQQKKQFWDTLAKHYPHFNTPSMSKDVQEILAWTKEQGIAYAPQSTLLDIGSGTGTFSIPLALLHVKVTAIDPSANMLAVLEEDARNEGVIERIKIHQSDWNTFDVLTPYDIVLASMTPAIHDTFTIDKMIDASSKQGVFVSWGSYRLNPFVDALLQAHRPNELFSQTGSIKAQDVMARLDAKNCSYVSKCFETQWSDTYTFEEAKEYAKEQLERRSIAPDFSIIETLLHQCSSSEQIEIHTKAEKVILVWKH